MSDHPEQTIPAVDPGSSQELDPDLGNSDEWVQLVRDDFPALTQTVHGRPLVYLDNASTTQKPNQVMTALRTAYEKECGTIHRGANTLHPVASERFEGVREKVRRFIGAPKAQEVIFTRGTTESINLLAQTLGRSRLSAGDEVLVSSLEHHSNLIPWQRICAERGAQLRVIPLSAAGQIELEQVDRLINARTRIVAISHASNVLGTVLPVAAIAKLAHARGALVAVDGAQAAPHLRINVSTLDCDFYSFSAHKLYGPTGVGVLWGRARLLTELPPWQTGSEMALSVSAEQAVFRDIPYKFEAGTPPIAQVMGLGAALDYIQDCGRSAIAAHEAHMYAHGIRVLAALAPECGLRLLGSAASYLAETLAEPLAAPGAPELPPRRVRVAPILSFTVAGVSPSDLQTALDQEGIAVRAGHHCAQPLMQHLGVAATVRVSLGCYNTVAELDALAAAIPPAVRTLRGR